jgi:hypothetical protein
MRGGVRGRIRGRRWRLRGGLRECHGSGAAGWHAAGGTDAAHADAGADATAAAAPATATATPTPPTAAAAAAAAAAAPLPCAARVASAGATPRASGKHAYPHTPHGVRDDYRSPPRRYLNALLDRSPAAHPHSSRSPCPRGSATPARPAAKRDFRSARATGRTGLRRRTWAPHGIGIRDPLGIFLRPPLRIGVRPHGCLPNWLRRRSWW